MIAVVRCFRDPESIGIDYATLIGENIAIVRHTISLAQARTMSPDRLAVWLAEACGAAAATLTLQYPQHVNPVAHMQCYLAQRETWNRMWATHIASWQEEERGC